LDSGELFLLTHHAQNHCRREPGGREMDPSRSVDGGVRLRIEHNLVFIAGPVYGPSPHRRSERGHIHRPERRGNSAADDSPGCALRCHRHLHQTPSRRVTGSHTETKRRPLGCLHTQMARAGFIGRELNARVLRPRRIAGQSTYFNQLEAVILQQCFNRVARRLRPVGDERQRLRGCLHLLSCVHRKHALNP
jgi:hypothetical protein